MTAKAAASAVQPFATVTVRFFGPTEYELVTSGQMERVTLRMMERILTDTQKRVVIAKRDAFVRLTKQETANA